MNPRTVELRPMVAILFVLTLVTTFGVIHVVPNMIREADQVLAYIEGLGIRSESWR